MSNCFAQAPGDIAQVVALVRREAGEEFDHGHPLATDFDGCVRDAVLDLWGSRIKSSVPLLALRHVRACVRAGSCPPWVS